MTQPNASAWSRSHVEAWLTAAALPIILLTSAPANHWPTAWQLILALATWAPLTLRTRWPLGVTAVVVILDAVHIIGAAHAQPPQGTIPVATILALYTVGQGCSARIAWSTAAITAAAQFAAAEIALPDELGRNLLYLNWAMVATVIGLLVRERRQRIAAAEERADEAERTKAQEARRQVIDERIRIARELHDALAHHLTIVNTQAGVAHYLLRTNPDAAEQALAGITNNTRAALDDLRATLGLLRSDRDHADDSRTPTPGLDQLPALVTSLANAGTAVTLTSHGTPRGLSGAGELAIYRIAQEALTNATKHAPGSTIAVVLDWTDTEIALTVTNTRSTVPARINNRPGHGLIGMRERVATAGGTVVLGPTADHGYRVLARIPVSPTSSPDHDYQPHIGRLS